MLIDLLTIMAIKSIAKSLHYFSEFFNKLKTFNCQEVFQLSQALYMVSKLWTNNIISNFTQHVPEYCL